MDGAGTVYVADYHNNRVVALAAGSSTQTELPFKGLGQPVAIAVDRDGNVYLADRSKDQVVKLPAGSR